MTREDLINAMPIIKAFIDGKKLQYKDLNQEWEDLEVNDIDLDDFVKSAWRIKPEPEYRPFKDAEECWAEMEKHSPFGWVKDYDGSKFTIEIVYSINSSIYVSDEGTCSFGEVFEKFKFADGTPFGVKVEE